MIPLLISISLLVPIPRIVLMAKEQLTSAPVSREMIDRDIEFYGAVYGVATSTLNKVIQCESSFNQYAIGDSGHSRGLVQIFDDYNPDITDSMAFNTSFSINFLAKNISRGKGNLWTCWRKHFGRSHI